jgi:hypothetical protein
LDEPIRFPNLYGTDRVTNVEINIGLDGHDLFGSIKSSSITLKGRLVRIFNNPLDYMPVNLADKDGILVGEAFIDDQGLEDDTHVYCLLVWTSNKYNYHGGPDDDASTFSVWLNQPHSLILRKVREPSTFERLGVLFPRKAEARTYPDSLIHQKEKGLPIPQVYRNAWRLTVTLI